MSGGARGNKEKVLESDDNLISFTSLSDRGKRQLLHSTFLAELGSLNKHEIMLASLI